ncbi:MAG: peptidoglycan DD-metalloendopeptidase family protein [Gammaproteobacteria bacterium]|nr:peptidoglycan DD-metalloendopeptidase family protein [Rhodocyclaceae bacterium]MBU3908282.1 peptidoglycan DD-metalloendopeptidase family protein [Gammaproteobacteria bacterium]MBU3988756.1 peptidoglycan DD-metalloendopeptidase family protein [Gammaproteobacteria bacterium]MBU4003081.1 peptidoglycan DD-metalloendopeptidase family protein [Gammaproteobacteria bacterium]MBU4019923.1 peptidoglycan DD-metalloendopeptidase family protein [Gammaproteobacteria bacterium]
MIRHLALVFLLCLPGLVLAAGEREKAKLESLREQRATLERQLKESESSRAETVDQLRDTEKAISTVGRKLRALSEERTTARSELSERERDLKQMERQTANRQAQLARLLRYQFRPREADALAVLLAGDDPNVTYRDRHFLTLLSRAQADLIANLRRDTAETQRLAAVVQQRNEKLTTLAQREESERVALRQRQQERQTVLARISGQIKEQRREIDTLKQNEQRLGSLIATLAKRAVKPKPPVSQRPGRRGDSAAPPVVSVEPSNASGAFIKLRGKLLRPAKGVTTGRFGARRDDGQTTWKGMFIRAAEGADVHAVAAGVVVFADWLRGYGNLLIIDHDDDFLSIYGNNQSVLADVGQKVGAGATVATVGASGGQPESGLYFELRHQGRAFDPAKWLSVP